MSCIFYIHPLKYNRVITRPFKRNPLHFCVSATLLLPNPPYLSPGEDPVLVDIVQTEGPPQLVLHAEGGGGEVTLSQIVNYLLDVSRSQVVLYVTLSRYMVPLYTELVSETSHVIILGHIQHDRGGTSDNEITKVPKTFLMKHHVKN